MTDEYKERIIKWLTGNYEIEQSSTDPLFQELNETTIGLSSLIDEIIGYIQGKDGKGNDLDIGFVYGNKNNKGVILIVDNNFDVIQNISEYDTGTEFGKFVCLNIDKTNGNIYGIDISSSKYRFILLNNFLIKTPNQQLYTVKLRNSYFITFTNNTFIPKYVDKKPNDSFYIIIGNYEDSSSQMGDYLEPAVATYKIEVGSTNELNDYYYSNSENYRNYFVKAYNIIWSGDEYNIKISGFNWFQINPGYSAEIYYQEFNFENETFSLEKNIELTFSKSDITEFEATSDFIMNNTNSYVVVFSTELGASETVLYKILEDSYEEYEKIRQTTAIDFKIGGGKLFKKNNQIFYFMYLNTTESSNLKYTEFTIEFGAIIDNSGNPYITKKKLEGELLYSTLADSIVFNVSNTYNLYRYNVIGSVPEGFSTNGSLSIQQILNPLNYNFEDYQDFNSLIPNSAWLYNNNEIIYARNLYNKVVSGNTTTSTVEVPNLLLNDIDIEQQDLLGQTNGTLVSNIDTIQKNIYEDLYINFYNTLTMQNQNTQDYITNIVGASRLNGSISNTADYSNTKLTKIRINYSDDTSLVKAINPATRISQFVYQYSFNIYVPGTKDITNIEMISQDESTVYQTITGLSLERSKSYNITQNVEIGE